MTVFISGGLNLSSPLYTPCHFSSTVMSALPSAKWPSEDLKRATRPIMLDFYQTALSIKVFNIHSLTALPTFSDFSWVSDGKAGPHETPRPPHTPMWQLSETEYPPRAMPVLFDVFDIWERWRIQWVDHHWFNWCYFLKPLGLLCWKKTSSHFQTKKTIIAAEDTNNQLFLHKQL